MITEKLKGGINVEVLGDLFSNLHGMISFFSTGLFLMILFWILMNAFLSGGLFNSLRASSGRFLPAEFFRASAKNFWSFLSVSLLLSFIILLLAILIISVPLAIVGQADSQAEDALFRTFIIVLPVFLLFLTVLLLVADYARAWIVIPAVVLHKDTA